MVMNQMEFNYTARELYAAWVLTRLYGHYYIPEQAIVRTCSGIIFSSLILSRLRSRQRTCIR